MATNEEVEALRQEAANLRADIADTKADRLQVQLDAQNASDAAQLRDEVARLKAELKYEKGVTQSQIEAVNRDPDTRMEPEAPVVGADAIESSSTVESTPHPTEETVTSDNPSDHVEVSSVDIPSIEEKPNEAAVVDENDTDDAPVDGEER